MDGGVSEIFYIGGKDGSKCMTTNILTGGRGALYLLSSGRSGLREERNTVMKKGITFPSGEM